ncbi:MAG: hypothetical protein LC620_08625, partial [Halobacteriales archaeon]|nr:hypothetical protein [Halobacteriales archaeon]
MLGIASARLGPADLAKVLDRTTRDIADLGSNGTATNEYWTDCGPRLTTVPGRGTAMDGCGHVPGPGWSDLSDLLIALQSWAQDQDRSTAWT